MATARHVHDVIERYGTCLELVPLDPFFHSISVGFYWKDGVGTVWTFSRHPGVDERIRQIRDRMVTIGGLEPVTGTHNQVRFPCGMLHLRPVKFLLMQVVEKNPEFAPPEGELSIKDTRTRLTLKVAPRTDGASWVYDLSAEGEAPNIPQRLNAVIGGFVRYGEMKKVGPTSVAFACGQRHDELARLLLPYSRNMSAVEDLMSAAAMRGQLTTGTAGFTPV